jgi:hypothetical protein
MRPGVCGRGGPLPITEDEMSKLRMITCTLVAAVCALGLSVGAAAAESQSAPTQLDETGKPVPAGVCFLHDIVP